MTAKFTVIDSQVLSTSAASVTFSSIPGGYKDLVLVVGGNNTANDTRATKIQLNSDSGSNYSQVFMTGNGSSSSAFATTTTYFEGGSTGPNGRLDTLQFMDFSATDKHKSIIGRYSAASVNVGAFAARWANTSAINSIYLFPSSGQFATGSTFRLLGVN
jgi:hypothetical protein